MGMSVCAWLGHSHMHVNAYHEGEQDQQDLHCAVATIGDVAVEHIWRLCGAGQGDQVSATRATRVLLCAAVCLHGRTCMALHAWLCWAHLARWEAVLVKDPQHILGTAALRGLAAQRPTTAARPGPVHTSSWPWVSPMTKALPPAGISTRCSASGTCEHRCD